MLNRDRTCSRESKHTFIYPFHWFPGKQCPAESFSYEKRRSFLLSLIDWEIYLSHYYPNEKDQLCLTVKGAFPFETTLARLWTLSKQKDRSAYRSYTSRSIWESPRSLTYYCFTASWSSKLWKEIRTVINFNIAKDDLRFQAGTRTSFYHQWSPQQEKYLVQERPNTRRFASVSFRVKKKRNKCLLNFPHFFSPPLWEEIFLFSLRKSTDFSARFWPPTFFQSPLEDLQRSAYQRANPEPKTNSLNEWKARKIAANL